jgi:hypothetical protein
LRDVPNQSKFPQKIDWPTPPKSAKKEKWYDHDHKQSRDIHRRWYAV